MKEGGRIMSRIEEITRENWILNTFPEWGTWLNEEIEMEDVKTGNCCDVVAWLYTESGSRHPEDCNISIDLWCGNGKRTHGNGKMAVGHQMANMSGARMMQPNLRGSSVCT